MRPLLAALVVVVVGCSSNVAPEVLGEAVVAPTVLSTVITAPVTPAGAMLGPTIGAEPRIVAADDPCVTLLGDGLVGCGVVEAGPGRVVWSLDEPRPDHPGWTATIWRDTSAGLVAALRAQDPTGSRWVAVVARQLDLDSDGVDEIVFAFRETGSSAFVQLDVVDASSASVTHHRSIDGGRLAFTDAGIVFWEASRSAADPVCCPDFYDEWLIEMGPGPLVEALLAPVAADEVPEGDLASG